MLTLIGLRARTPDGTAALSGFTQSLGYLMAAIGPFAVGLAARRHRRLDRPAVAAAGRWCVPLLAVGLYAGRPAYLEDQLAGSSGGVAVNR